MTFLVLYTFDFRDNTSITPQCMGEYLMLVASIQSVFDNEWNDKRVILLTSDPVIRRCIDQEFGGAVEILESGSSDRCRQKLFTCAGHARIDALADRAGQGDHVLYVDNDTILHPLAMQRLAAEGCVLGYMPEMWNTLRAWNHTIAPDADYTTRMNDACARLTSADRLDQFIINCGAQYFPPTERGGEVARDVREIYEDLLGSVGYSYGLDQVAFTLALMRAGCDHRSMFHNDRTGTVLHVYLNKQAYLDRLAAAGLRVNPETGLVNMFHHQNLVRRLGLSPPFIF